MRPMRRYSTTFGSKYSFGPGPVSTAVKALIWANIGMFVLSFLVPSITVLLGLMPAAVFKLGRVWQPLTYMFLHQGFFHILFNMLILWMFGAELERMWGTRFFLKYYFVAGLGAAATTILLSLLPFAFADAMYYSLTIGASGAIYGLLLAYGWYFPDRSVYMYFLFPIPARTFVLILGAIAFLSSISGSGNGIAHTAHLGGLLAGYLYLTLQRFRPVAAVRHGYARWKMNRLRRKFGIHSGGRSSDWERRVH
jgi:membrane associated rhomboid family serine protease